MELKQALEKLKKSQEYKTLDESSPDIFFSYALNIIEDSEKHSWQIGFYHASNDKITSFVIDEHKIEVQDEEEIFKKPDMKINKIDLEKVKMTFNEILKKAEEFQRSKYPKELINETIAILQNLEDYGTIWNITYITHAFNTLNMKINPENGEIVNHNLESLMSIIKK